MGALCQECCAVLQQARGPQGRGYDLASGVRRRKMVSFLGISLSLYFLYLFPSTKHPPHPHLNLNPVLTLACLQLLRFSSKILGLLGPSGCGKTTFLKCLVHLRHLFFPDFISHLFPVLLFHPWLITHPIISLFYSSLPFPLMFTAFSQRLGGSLYTEAASRCWGESPAAPAMKCQGVWSDTCHRR